MKRFLILFLFLGLKAQSAAPKDLSGFGLDLGLAQSPVSTLLSISLTYDPSPYFRIQGAAGPVGWPPEDLQQTLWSGSVRFFFTKERASWTGRPFVQLGYTEFRQAQAITEDPQATDFMELENQKFPEIWIGFEQVYRKHLRFSFGLELLQLGTRATAIHSVARNAWQKAETAWNDEDRGVSGRFAGVLHGASAVLSYFGMLGFQIGVQF